MTCDSIDIGGTRTIVCSRRRRYACVECRMPSIFQCDWKTGKKTAKGKPERCDDHLCGRHALEVAKDKHLCPRHQRAYQARQEQRKAKAA